MNSRVQKILAPSLCIALLLQTQPSQAGVADALRAGVTRFKTALGLNKTELAAAAKVDLNDLSSGTRNLFTDTQIEDEISRNSGGLFRSFTARVKYRLFPQTIGRSNEVESLITNLNTLNSVGTIIEGAEGVGKTHILVALQERALEGSLPEKLRGLQIVEVVPEHKLMSDFEGFKTQLAKLFDQMSSQSKSQESGKKMPLTVIHIPRLHQFMGQDSGGRANAALLDMYIEVAQSQFGRENVRFVIEGFPSQLQTIRMASSNLVRMNVIKVEALGTGQIYKMAQEMAQSLKKELGYSISDATLEKAIHLVQKWDSGFGAPAALYRLLVGSVSLKQTLLTAKTSPFSDLLRSELETLQLEATRVNRILQDNSSNSPLLFAQERKLAIPNEISVKQQLITEADKKFSQIQELKARAAKLKAEIAAQKGRQLSADQIRELQSIESSLNTLDIEDLALFTSRRTGISLDEILASNKVLTTIEKETIYNRRLFGLSRVVKALSDVGIKLKNAGRTSKGPVASHLYLGPASSGKTESALALADIEFGGKILRLNMSEYKSQESVKRLIGADPGYVGYEQGGTLTNWVRQFPRSVILIDEIEKAHPTILDILFQILDKSAGTLTDGQGRTAYFRDAAVILTTNLLEGVDTAKMSRDDLIKALSETPQFAGKHALLTRFEEIIGFGNPSLEAKGRILGKFINSINVELAKSTRKIRLHESAIRHLIQDKWKDRMVAREILNHIDTEIEGRIAEITAHGRYTNSAGEPIEVAFREGDLLEITYMNGTGYNFRVIQNEAGQTIGPLNLSPVRGGN